MNVLRPRCVVCFKQDREPGSVRCHACGPGRIKPQPKPRKTRVQRAAEEINATD